MSRWTFPYKQHRHDPTVPGAPALEVRNLCVRYARHQPPVFENLCLALFRGTRVALTGPNGAGKSTLLKAIAGIIDAEGGSVELFGSPKGSCHHRVAYLAQKAAIDWRFPVTVRQFVTAGRYVHLGWLRRPRESDRKMVQSVLERLGLTALADRRIGELSGGQQQRCLVARALCQESEIYLLDEPLSGVDSATREVLAALTRELTATGRTVLTATHHHDRLAAEFDEVLHLQHGLLTPSVPEPLTVVAPEVPCTT